MATFNDSKGREWIIRLDFALCRKLKNLVGVDLLSSQTAIVVCGLATDRSKLAESLWLLVAEQAGAKELGQDDFFKALDGDALSAGWGAVVSAVENFTPPAARPAMTAAIEAQIQAMANAATALATTLSSPEFAAVVEEKISAMKAATMAAIIGNPASA